MSVDSLLATVLPAWGFSARATATPLEGGLINRTYRLDEADRRTVLQRLHPIFAPTVNLDIAAITEHIAARGMLTPRVVPTLDGALWVIDREGFSWRMLTWLAGRTVHTVERPELARSAAALVARFHAAVRDLEHTFAFSRPGAHDTPQHLAKLELALQEHAAHPRLAQVEPVARRILERARALPVLPTEPRRVVHGDLKISNILFAADSDEALALLDLDTMAELTVPIELGDALRSWCNQGGEDAERVHFRADVFEAALAGYAPAASSWLTPTERAALVLGVETITLELSARFAADALHESYFGWNAQKFASRSEHNLARARSQLALADSVADQRAELERMVQARLG